MATNKPADVEAEDAEKVNRAVEALAAGDFSEAEALLTAVVANTPAEYVNASENAAGTLLVKFWDRNAFVHYVMWQEEHGIERSVNWIGNAYPRAYYHLGFICVKRRQFERALEYLEKGCELEPANPLFAFERAKALMLAGNRERALALYQSVHTTGPHVSARNLATARRGSGFVLIELGRLDEAEEEFRASLDLEPENPIALDELLYIDHLRRGGGEAPAGAVAVQPPDLSRCVACGNNFTEGTLINADGRPAAICKGCQRKLTKKWWQFWK